MARYHFLGRAVDTYGNAKPNETIRVYLAYTNTPVTIYLDKDDVSSVGGIVTTDAYGRFDFWVSDEDYDATTLFDIVAAGLTYEDIEIMRGLKAHGALLDLRGTDHHPQYANLSQNETVSGAWTFTEAVTGTHPYRGRHLTTKNYVDVINDGIHEHLDDIQDELRTLELSAGQRFYQVETDLDDIQRELREVSLSAGIYLDDIQGELRTLELSASIRLDGIDTRITSVSAASREADNRQNEYLLTAVQPLSAAVDEKDNRLYELIDLVSGASREADNRTYELIDLVSGASREADNRQNEYLLTAVQPLSAAVDEKDNRIKESITVLRIDVDDVRNDLLSTQVSANGVFNDLRHRLHTHEVSAKVIFDELQHEIVQISLSAGQALHDLRGRLHTFEVSTKGELDDVVDELRTFELSAGQRFYTVETNLDDLRLDFVTTQISAGQIFDELQGEVIQLSLSAGEALHDIRHRLFTHATSGYPDNDHTVHVQYHHDRSEPTGFVERDSSTIRFAVSEGTSTFTLSAANTVVYRHGTQYILNGAYTKVITDTEGMHHIYYNPLTNVLAELAAFDAETLLKDNIYVAAIYWDATNNKHIYMGDERHSIMWDWSLHAYHHITEGTRYVSGLGLYGITADGDGDSAATCIFSIGSGIIWDEDLAHSSGEMVDAYVPVYYRSGIDGDWRIQEPLSYPAIRYSAGNTRIAWNEFTGGAWQQTETSNTNFTLSHIFATNDPRRSVIAIQGQAEYATLLAARTGATEEIYNLSIGSMPFAEFIPIASLIWQTDTAYDNAARGRLRTTDTGDDWIDHRQTKGISTGGASINDHGNLSGLSDDDHAQYAPLNGARDFTGTVGGITPVIGSDFATKNYVDTIGLSGVTASTVLAYQVSAASREADNRQNEYLLTAVQPLSAAVVEKNNRQDEYNDVQFDDLHGRLTSLAVSTGIVFGDIQYDVLTLTGMISAASREADHRQDEYLLTAVAPLSAAVDEKNHRQDEYTTVQLSDLRGYLNTHLTSADHYQIVAGENVGVIYNDSTRTIQISAAPGAKRLYEETTDAPKTVFDLPFTISPLSNNLAVYINGVFQSPYAWTAISPSGVELSEEVPTGTNVIFVSGEPASFTMPSEAALTLEFSKYVKKDGTTPITGHQRLTSSVGISGDCRIGDDCFVGDMLHVGPSGSFEYGVGPSGSDQPQGSAPLGYHGEFYATKVFNAVWQDIADFQKVEGRVEFGRAYYMTETGVRICNERCQLGLAGICSDTYGYGIGMAPGRAPIAVAGWVLAYVDRIYTPGTSLTNNELGSLTEMSAEEKLLYPERMVALYHKPEVEEYYEKVKVNGRHWVKVR